MNKKIIGLAGGVGPMAGVKLHEKIIQQTLNGGTDQGHLPIIHISYSQKIPDRTKYLLGEVKEDPAEAMLSVVTMIGQATKTEKTSVVVGIPCNTFHAPKIWDRFCEGIKRESLDVQVVHMLEETADFISKLLPKAKKIGLMSTTGTRKVNVYREIFEPRGYKILEVPSEFQDELHDSIYNPVWGIKAVSPVTKKARDNFEGYLDVLIKMGADAVILGCTEIPLALPETKFKGIPLIDPMLALARALIYRIDPQKLKLLE